MEHKSNCMKNWVECVVHSLGQGRLLKMETLSTICSTFLEREKYYYT